MQLSALFKIDALNGFISFAIAVLSVLTFVYSLRFMQEKSKRVQYYFLMIFTSFASVGVTLTNNLIMLLVLWGFLGLTLYLLVGLGEKDTSLIAKKTFIIVGGTDALLLLGISLIYYLGGSWNIYAVRLELNNPIAAVAYACIAIACFAKSGLMPFHSWIAECSEKAPLPVAAFLLAAVDKILGIYLLARLTLYMFSPNEALNALLMILGAITIIIALMMALVQNNARRLLGFQTVSQVGYMAIGLGTGNPIGIAGGLFHLINHALYKSCLFFGEGNVEYRAKTAELNQLGGMARFMPATYISCLIAALANSGIPPLNGFFSKWMIYQGLLIDLQGAAGRWMSLVYAFALIAAMFGSALTLANSFKLIHSVFLGQRNTQDRLKDVADVPWLMRFPCVTLAVLCIVFGVFAMQVPFKYFLNPLFGNVKFIGKWSSSTSTLLIIVSLALGFLIFRAGLFRVRLRRDNNFTGGEVVDFDKFRVTGTEFYNTVSDINILSLLYKKANDGVFDIYEQAKKPLFYTGEVLKRLHNGVLPTYITWCLLGMTIFFFWCVR
jgi:formate hydrogenlyase subunit 3/multisubunit Na+/H+ antiporter MnhD subunit